ncbi:hypothetical protein BU16DRAFT_593485 [Lophium mytilinum]|uniref:Apple domain-containing protein n=1 Tax=Lophium mytilinum TaxID=390894 RepID=A0A6A6QIU7_9PEZI|nr:hypothetical protein BU16DRAFT_593485 [Lophium mytilinum]
MSRLIHLATLFSLFTIKVTSQSSSDSLNIDNRISPRPPLLPNPTCPSSNDTTYTAGNGSNFQILCGLDFFLNDLRNHNASTFAVCLDLCDATQGCKGVSYEDITKTCYMKNTTRDVPRVKSIEWSAFLVSDGDNNSTLSTNGTIASNGPLPYPTAPSAVPIPYPNSTTISLLPTPPHVQTVHTTITRTRTRTITITRHATPTKPTRSSTPSTLLPFTCPTRIPLTCLPQKAPCECQKGTPTGVYCGYCSQVLSCAGGVCEDKAFACGDDGSCRDYGLLQVCVENEQGKTKGFCPIAL